MRKAANALFLLAVFVPGCASNTPAANGPPASASASASANAPLGSGSAGAHPSTGASRTSDSTASGSKSSGAQAGSAQDHSLPLSVTLNKSCAHAGDTMIARAVSVPNATMAFVTSYSGKYTPDYTWVPEEGNPSGSFTWTWTLRPDVPKGTATLKVVAGLAKENRGAAKTLTFEVATLC